MIAAPFEPVGERAKWESVYELLLPLDVGDVVTYEQLAEVLEVDPSERGKIRPHFTKAANVFGRERLRAFVPVVNVGYRMVDAPEHELIARRQHRKSRRALKRAATAFETTDRSRLSPEERVRIDALEQTVRRQSDLIRRLDARQVKTEQEVRVTQAKQDEIAERVAALEERVGKT